MKCANKIAKYEQLCGIEVTRSFARRHVVQKL